MHSSAPKDISSCVHIGCSQIKLFNTLSTVLYAPFEQHFKTLHKDMYKYLLLAEKAVGKLALNVSSLHPPLISHLCFIIHSYLAIQHGHLKPSAPAHAQMSDFVGLGGSQIKAKQSDSPVARGALCF